MRKYLFLGLVALCAAGSAFAQEAVKPLRALLVCGGCCHDYTAQKKILSEGISARANVEWTIVHEGIPTKGDDGRKTRVSIYEKPDWWKGYDIILHDECFGYVDDNAFVENITAAHQAGVPAVLLHCSTHSYRMATTEEWHRLLGITSHSHEKARELEVKAEQGDHPVMRGFPPNFADKQDELYKNEVVDPTVVPLAKAYGQETKQDHIVIWLNQYGPARVFCTTLGHTNETVSSETYLDLVTRGLLWACDKLADDGTPKPGYAAAKK